MSVSECPKTLDTHNQVGKSREGHMRAARLAHSPRLQALHELLAERGASGATSREIVLETGSCAPHSDVAELRANGLDVQCALDHVSPNRRRVYRYTLVRPPGKAA